MRVIATSNDPVRLSFLAALLTHAGIASPPLDHPAPVMHGSIRPIQRRLAVPDADPPPARPVLAQAGAPCVANTHGTLLRRRAPFATFDADIQPGLVRGQPVLLERAVLNLLDNALKYGPEEQTITVRLSSSQPTLIRRSAMPAPEIWCGSVIMNRSAGSSIPATR